MGIVDSILKVARVSPLCLSLIENISFKNSNFKMSPFLVSKLYKLEVLIVPKRAMEWVGILGLCSL